MKKLALAPAVAIAITGLAASPVIAAPEVPAPAASTDTQPAAQPDAKAALAKTNDQSSGNTERQEDVDPQKLEAEISVSPDEVTQSDLVDPETAVKVTITGLEEGDAITDDVSFEEGETVTAEGASYTYTIYNKTGDPEAVAPGTIDFTVTVQRGDERQELSGSFTVVEDSEDPETPAADPKISVSDKEPTAEELQKNGITVEGEGFTPGGEVVLVGGSAQSAFGTATVTADDNGKVSGTVKSETALDPGEYSVWGSDQETEKTSEPVTVTVVEEETEEPSTPATEAELTVSPEVISPGDFVKEDKGVTLAVENCEPGEDVEFVVNPEGDSNVTAYENTVKADDEGKASVNVYGTSADASAYIGDYDVIVTCGDAELTGEFSVSDDANAGGSDGDEDGNDSADGNDNGGSDGADNGDGGDLPRTGTELTGLVGGAGLLLIGGVAVALTMRRKKVAEDPSEI